MRDQPQSFFVFFVMKSRLSKVTIAASEEILLVECLCSLPAQWEEEGVKWPCYMHLDRHRGGDDITGWVRNVAGCAS